MSITTEYPSAVAKARFVRVSPTKARRVIDLVRGKSVTEALHILRWSPQAASEPVAKVIASAAANAQNNEGLDPSTLVVATVYADEGPTAKRWRPRARGRGTRIRKRTSHITIVVAVPGDDDRHVARALADPRAAAPRTWPPPLRRRALVGVGAGDEELVGGHVVVVLGVRDRRVQELLELARDRAVAQREGVARSRDVLAQDQLQDRTHLRGRRPNVSQAGDGASGAHRRDDLS